MNEAVFISDLHLHPNEVSITNRFYQFLDWAHDNTEKLFILGDFFHAWAGDEGLDEWSMGIANRLRALASSGITLYFMHGNRDFLLGKTFLKSAHLHILSDPTLIQLGDSPVLLTHGDQFCTKDKPHQCLRRLTRNRYFPWLFLKLPYSIRRSIVLKVREHSQNNRKKMDLECCSGQPKVNTRGQGGAVSQRALEYKLPPTAPRDIDFARNGGQDQKRQSRYAVVEASIFKTMRKWRVNQLIHGHTHLPGLTQHEQNSHKINRFVLSDWDDKPQILCYHKTNGFYYTRF